MPSILPPVRHNIAAHAAVAIVLAIGSSVAQAPGGSGAAPAAPKLPAGVSIQATVEDPAAPGSFRAAAVVSPEANVTRMIEVTNVGSVPLAAATVTGSDVPECDRDLPDTNGSAPGILDPGQTHSHTCSGPVSPDGRATARVAARDMSGVTMAASDSASLDVIAPALQVATDLRTRAGGWSAADSEIGAPALRRGATALFRIRVTNQGNVALSGVAVSNATVTTCLRGIGRLAPGQSASFTCALDGIEAPVHNVTAVTASVEGQPERVVTDSDRAHARLLAPRGSLAAQLSIHTTGPAQARGGETIQYAIEIRNVGRQRALGVVVEDLLPPGIVAVRRPGVVRSGPAHPRWRLGTVRPGESRRIVFDARVLRTTSGRSVNSAVVRAANAPRVRARGTTVVRVAEAAALPPVAG